jgi:Ca-activated chloride channel family protein
MLTPLVIAMPQPMAEALGYPEKPLGFADIIALANDPEGWAAFGHPEWGPFRRKDQSELLDERAEHTISQYYAATASRSLTTDLNRRR